MADVTDLIHGVEFRPKIYISIYSVQGKYNVRTGKWSVLNPATGLLGPEVAGPTFGSSPIGAVQRLTINSTREVNVWRELNYDIAGKPIESYPGLPSYELSMQRIVLYKSTYPVAFGFEDFDVLKQNKPLTLQVTMQDPDGTTTSNNTKVWWIHGVWFKDNPMEFDISEVGDLRIIQDVSAIAAGIIEGKQG